MTFRTVNIQKKEKSVGFANFIQPVLNAFNHLDMLYSHVFMTYHYDMLYNHVFVTYHYDLLYSHVFVTYEHLFTIF